MIRIKSQSGTNQYDDSGRAITEWHGKKGAWIVLPEFEKENIDWYGTDSDFPGGYTLKEYEDQHPNWEKLPDISVAWYWNDKETCIKAFGLPHTFGEKSNFWDKQLYPYHGIRSWGDIDAKKEDVVKRFGTYCSFHLHADRVIVKYNSEVLLDGKLV